MEAMAGGSGKVNSLGTPRQNQQPFICWGLLPDGEFGFSIGGDGINDNESRGFPPGKHWEAAIRWRLELYGKYLCARVRSSWDRKHDFPCESAALIPLPCIFTLVSF